MIDVTTGPQSTKQIAERARVSEPTARRHLTALAETGRVKTITTDSGTRYMRTTQMLAMRRIADITLERIRSGDPAHTPGRLLSQNTGKWFFCNAPLEMCAGLARDLALPEPPFAAPLAALPRRFCISRVAARSDCYRSTTFRHRTATERSGRSCVRTLGDLVHTPDRHAAVPRAGTPLQPRT